MSIAALIRTTKEFQATLAVTSGTDEFQRLTDWMPCIAMDTAIGTLKAVNLSGNISIKVAVQFASERTDTPSAATAVGAAVTMAGENFVAASDFNLSASVPTNAFVRFGLAAHVTSTPNTGRADVSLQISMLQLGGIVSPWSGHLVATSATKQFIPIGPWMPALSVLKFQPVINVADISGFYDVTSGSLGQADVSVLLGVRHTT